FSRVAGRALSPLVDACIPDGGSEVHATHQGSGSTGLIASAALGTAYLPRIVGSTIGGGVGTNAAGGGAATLGVTAFQVNIELVRDSITGGTYDGLTQLGSAVGVNAVSSTLVVERSSILGANGNYQASSVSCSATRRARGWTTT
ncbi:MAG: hypothetical protein FJ104_07040, partial [Deltaproteobacteria bacterium]|nr:hypothetical protein [Deltaproteobacteria bacterium]